MTDHEIPDENPEEPGQDVLEEAALRTALAAVPDPPAGQLERAVQVALDAFDVAHYGHDTTVVPVRAPRRGGAVGAHRRLAAVAAVMVALVGLAGILIAQDRPDSTPSDVAAAPREASLEQPATTTTPSAGLGGAGTLTAREQGEDDAATSDQQAGAAATSAAPTRTQEAPSLPPQGSPSTTRELGSYGDVASLLAAVMADPVATAGSGGGVSTGGDGDSSPATATGAAGTGCAPPGSSTIGDATVGGTRMVVTLDGDPTDPAARIRVYVASGCAPVVDAPLGG